MSTTGWRYASCLSPVSNMSHLFDQKSKSLPWTPYVSRDDPTWEWAKAMDYCAMPARGTFSRARQHDASRRAQNAVRNSGCHETWFPNQTRVSWKRDAPKVLLDGIGVWTTPNQWQPSARCENGPRTREQVLRCLAGRVLIFEGDSLSRQLFLRTIWWLRGIPILMEHFFHQHAVCIFSPP